MAIITKDLVADFGATCNGVADDAAAFAAFNAWALANQGSDSIVLTIPSGGIAMIKSGGLVMPALGINDLTVRGLGSGATISDGGVGVYLLGSLAIYQDADHSARTQTVSAGASAVTLIDSAKASMFTVGQYALMTGIDLQGSGYPTNHHFFEYVLITGKSGSTISFSPPLRWSYKSTWPLFNPGNTAALQEDMGGPATLYALDPSWKCSVRYEKITFVRATQFSASGKNVTFVDCVCNGTGNSVLYPTMSDTFTAINFTQTNGDMECDKLATTVTFQGGTIKNINFQSSSIDTLNLDGTTITEYLLGTPKYTSINNATIGTLRPGAYDYGSSYSIAANNSKIVTIEQAPAGRKYTGVFGGGVNNEWTINASTGVITVPRNANAFIAAKSVNWAIPGQMCGWFDADRNCIQMFKILDLTDDASNIYVHTDWLRPFPTPSSGVLGVRAHPCPSITFSGCSATTPGANDNSDAWLLSQAPAARPIFSYYKRASSGAVQQYADFLMWGNITSISTTVATAYSGATGTVNFNPIGSHNWTSKLDLSLNNYVQIINTKQASLTPRLLTVAGGAQSKSGVLAGDTIPDLAEVPTWMANKAFGYFAADISGEPSGVRPSIIVEVFTDQGLTSEPGPPGDMTPMMTFQTTSSVCYRGRH